MSWEPPKAELVQAVRCVSWFTETANGIVASPLPHFPGITTGQIHPCLADKSAVGQDWKKCDITPDLKEQMRYRNSHKKCSHLPCSSWRSCMADPWAPWLLEEKQSTWPVPGQAFSQLGTSHRRLATTMRCWDHWHCIKESKLPSLVSHLRQLANHDSWASCWACSCCSNKSLFKKTNKERIAKAISASILFKF